MSCQLQLNVDIPISKSQMDAIVTILSKQCQLLALRDAKNGKEYPGLYDEFYMKGRRHSNTAAILAGFQENTVIPGMKIQKKKYGQIHWQPEISSETVILHIYSSEAGLNTKEIKNKCAQYNTNGSTQEYCIVQFFVGKKGRLNRVDFIRLDAFANIYSRTVVYSHHRLTDVA